MTKSEKRDIRVGELQKLNIFLDNETGEYKNRGIVIHKDEVYSMSDVKWRQFIENVRKYFLWK